MGLWENGCVIEVLFIISGIKQPIRVGSKSTTACKKWRLRTKAPGAKTGSINICKTTSFGLFQSPIEQIQVYVTFKDAKGAYVCQDKSFLSVQYSQLN